MEEYTVAVTVVLDPEPLAVAAVGMLRGFALFLEVARAMILLCLTRIA